MRDLRFYLVLFAGMCFGACAGDTDAAGDGPVTFDIQSHDLTVGFETGAPDLAPGDSWQQRDTSSPPPDKAVTPSDQKVPPPADQAPPPPDQGPPPPDTGPACQTAKDCDDTLSCTADACTAGKCLHTVNTNFCAINKSCVLIQTVDSKDPCKKCLPNINAWGWSDYLCTRTLAGFGQTGSTDGANSIARFYYPADVAYGTSGEVYVADSHNHGIRLVFGGQVSVLAGQGKAGYADGAASQARFKYPGGLAVGASGEIYVADTSNHLIRKIQNGKVSTVAGTGNAGYTDGFASAARFHSPAGLAVGPSGELYVADTNNHRVRMIFSGKVSTLAGTGSAGYQDGATATARFNGPADVEVGPKGAVYVADMYNHRVRKINNGLVSTVAGSGTAGLINGSASSARLYRPSGLTVGAGGEIYLADRYNHAIRKIHGGQVTTLSGSGKAGHADSPTLDIKFHHPTGVVAGPKNTIYVADHNNHRIRRITW